MAEPWFRFPVICPECRQEELSAMQIGGVAAALLKGEVIQLYASCHDIYWNARPVEVEQLRQYLALTTTTSERGPPATGERGGLNPPMESRHDLLPVL